MIRTRTSCLMKGLLLASLILLLGLPWSISQAAQQSSSIPAWRKAEAVAVLPITGPIDQVTATSIKRRIDQAVENGADAIVFEINTPGGELMSTLEICRIIKYESPANTVAWIHPYAFSAGTIIALACREIVVSPDATFGDSAPVSPLGPIPLAERAKLEAPILSEVIDSARRRHYDEQLVQAFVSVGVELWMLRNTTTNEIIFVDASEYETIYGTTPPAQMIDVETLTEEEVTFSPLFGNMGELDQGLETDSVAYEQLLPSSRPRLDGDSRNDWVLVGQVAADDRLLTLKPGEAQQFGLAAAIVNDRDELQLLMGASTVKVYDQSWSESLVQLLVSWPARIILVVIFLVCLFMEMTFPGTGLFAIGSVVSIVVLLGAPALAGMAEWWELIAVIIGLGLIAVEILLIPGTLVAGITGAILLMIGMVGTFVSGEMTDQEMQRGIVQGLLVILSGSFLAMLLIWLLTRTIERDTTTRGFILRTEVGKGVGQPTSKPVIETIPIGTTGVAETALRPSGRIRIDDQLLDAVSLGRWIEPGDEVRVVRTGMVLEVEATDS